MADWMQTRRSFLAAGGLVAGVALLPMASRADAESPLIYLSPIKSNGALSACQAEVWYVQDGADMCVVTAADAWRTRAIGQGLTDTQVWVGDVGLWQGSNGAYKQLPSLRATASLEQDAVSHARLLTLFGQKYVSEWGTWGPRFQEGLADGSRAMLRYAPT